MDKSSRKIHIILGKYNSSVNNLSCEIKDLEFIKYETLGVCFVVINPHSI